MFLTVHALSDTVKEMTRHAKTIDGRWIEYILRTRDWTQVQLAGALQDHMATFAKETISRIKTGARKPTESQRRAIRRVARVTIAQYEEGPPRV